LAMRAGSALGAAGAKFSLSRPGGGGKCFPVRDGAKKQPTGGRGLLNFAYGLFCSVFLVILRDPVDRLVGFVDAGVIRDAVLHQEGVLAAVFVVAA
jgi:hypothetical protein